MKWLTVFFIMSSAIFCSGIIFSQQSDNNTQLQQHLNKIMPDNYFLDQNRPNPFNPATNIKFSIPENATVKLNVYNLAGQEVAQLINDRRDAGNYEITFDANNYRLSSGVYFYTLSTSSGFRQTKKMILIK